MKELYGVMKTSKQGFHQFMNRQIKRQSISSQVVELANAIRDRNPSMGCRAMYSLMEPIPVGKDKCEQILLSHGFRLRRRKNFIRTTFSQEHLKYNDLIKGRVLTGIDQVWQSDITYYLSSNGSVYYIVFILDVYSRRILSWTANDNLKAEGNIECLRKAFKLRGGKDLQGLIHHSDRGSQYGDQEYLKILKTCRIRISMSKKAWQNAYVERINGTIKNDYLYAWNITTLQELRKGLAKATHAYNYEKPHRNLPNKMAPAVFEDLLMTTDRKHHPKFQIYNYENN
jgi:putative transposase